MNLPNALSTFRLLLVPVFAGVFFSGLPDAHRWAALIYTVAFATDVLDGWIARRYDMITRLGRILDPLADKLMTFTVIVCICLDGVLPMWAAVILFCKEAVMAIGGAVLMKRVRDVLPSHRLGKASTGTFFVVLALLTLFPIPKPWPTVLISAALILTVASLADYFLAYRKVLAEHPKEN